MSVDVAEVMEDQMTAAAAELQQLIDGLPENVRDHWTRELAAAVEEYRRGEDRKLERLIRGLQVSMHLHSMPDYQEALRAAEHADWASGGTEISEYLATRHDARRRT